MVSISRTYLEIYLREFLFLHIREETFLKSRQRNLLSLFFKITNLEKDMKIVSIYRTDLENLRLNRPWFIIERHKIVVSFISDERTGNIVSCNAN